MAVCMQCTPFLAFPFGFFFAVLFSLEKDKIQIYVNWKIKYGEGGEVVLKGTWPSFLAPFLLAAAVVSLTFVSLTFDNEVNIRHATQQHNQLNANRRTNTASD